MSERTTGMGVWERFAAWVAQARGPVEAAPGRAVPSALPELLRAVLADPGRLERRAVYADWLIEQGDPLGALINLELRDGPTWAVWRGYAALLPRVLGDLAPVLQATAFELGLPVEGVVMGGRPDLLEHPQWTALRHAQTDDPGVAGALARHGVPSLRVSGERALAAVADATLAGARVERLVLELDDLAVVPELRVPRVTLCGLLAHRGRGGRPLLERPVVEALLDSPLRELRVDTPDPPDPALVRRLDAHPTLKRYVWRGGQWGSGGPIEPFLPAWRPPWQMPGHLVPVRELSGGGDRRFWLVHDRQTGAARVAALLDENAGEPVAADVLRPLSTFGNDPRVELYPADLEPLGPRPWPPRVAAEVAGMLHRVALASDAGIAFQESLSQAFLRADGSPCLVAPLLRPAGPTAPPIPGIQPDAPQRWALESTRGPAPERDQTALLVRPGLFALIEASSFWARTGRVVELLDAILAEAPGDLDALIPDVLARPWEQFGSASMVAVSLTGRRLDVAWIGEAGAWAVGPRGCRPLTRPHSLDGRSTVEPEADEVGLAAPVLVRELGVGSQAAEPGEAFERRLVILEPDERVLLCTHTVTRIVGAPILHGLVEGRSPREAVSAVLSAYRSLRGPWNAAVMVVEPTPDTAG